MARCFATDKHGLTRTFLFSQMATDKHGLTRTFHCRRWPRTSTDSLGLFVIAYSHGQARTYSDFSLSQIATDKHGLTRTFRYRRWPRTSTDLLGLSLSHIATDKHGLTRTFHFSQMATDKHGLTRTFHCRRWPRTSTDLLGLFFVADGHGQARTYSDFSLSQIDIRAADDRAAEKSVCVRTLLSLREFRVSPC